MKKSCKSLKEHVAEIISFEKKRTTLLTNKEYISHHNQQICQFVKQKTKKISKENKLTIKILL